MCTYNCAHIGLELLIPLQSLVSASVICGNVHTQEFERCECCRCVGDPNQAINSTFTPADPVFFNQFCEANRPDRLATIDQAGRSTATIMAAANHMLRWVNQRFAQPPFREQAILPVPLDDPQPNANPAPLGRGV